MDDDLNRYTAFSLIQNIDSPNVDQLIEQPDSSRWKSIDEGGILLRDDQRRSLSRMIELDRNGSTLKIDQSMREYLSLKEDFQIQISPGLFFFRLLWF
jgi:hypothetical protein